MESSAVQKLTEEGGVSGVALSPPGCNQVGAHEVPTERTQLLLAAAALLVYVVVKFSHGVGWILQGGQAQQLLGSLLVVIILPVLAYSAAPVSFEAWRLIRAGRFSLELCWTLAAIALGAAFFYGFALDLAFPLKQPVHGSFFLLAVLVAPAAALQRKILREVELRKGYSLKDLMPTAKLVVTDSGTRIEHEDEERLVSASSLRLHDSIALAQGDLLPCDGVVASGCAIVREPLPGAGGRIRYKGVGSQIYGGSKLIRGKLIVSVAAEQSDSALSFFSDALKGLAEKAGHDEHGADQRLGMACALFLLLALTIAVIWFVKGASLTEAAGIFASMAVVTAIPWALCLNGRSLSLTLALLFNRGVLVRSLSSLRSLVDLRNLVVDLSISKLPGGKKVEAFDLIDQRLDENAMAGLLIAVLAAADDPQYSALSEYIAARYPNYCVMAVDEFNEYSGRGLCGTVQGVEISVGSEDLLIERGVELHHGDIIDSDNHVIYVALRDQVVARAELAKGFFSFFPLISRALRRLGVRIVLCSADNTSGLDRIGIRAGCEPSDIHGDLDERTFVEQLENLPDAALLPQESTGGVVRKAARVLFAAFDPLLYETESGDFIFFADNGALAALVTIAAAKRRAAAVKIILGLAFGISLALTVISAAGVAAPVLYFVVTVGVNVINALILLYLTSRPARLKKA